MGYQGIGNEGPILGRGVINQSRLENGVVWNKGQLGNGGILNQGQQVSQGGMFNQWQGGIDYIPVTQQITQSVKKERMVPVTNYVAQ